MKKRLHRANALIQGTDEWLDLRKKHIGASDAPAIMGVSPWRTPFELWQDKLGLAEPQKWNSAMQRGIDLEPIARSAFEKMTGIDVFPQVVFHPEHKFMMASLDGLSLCGKHAVEIKCTSKKNHALAKEGKVPDYYIPQLQHQMACLDVDSLYYFSFDGYNGVIVTVERDDEYIDDLIEKEMKFWVCVKNRKPPEISERDYTEKTDEMWLESANSIIEIEKQMKELKERKESLRNAIIKMSDGQNCQGGGVKVTKSYMQGRIDYSAVPELKDIDLEDYRKPDAVSWRLTIKT